METPAAITADALHDGEPAALAALCMHGGVPVLAYCDQVAAPRQVAAAAADAFARVRSQVVAAGEARHDIDVDELLLTATRHAAAARGMNAAIPPRDAAHGCDGLETSLAAQFDQPMTDDQRAQLESHLDHCAAHARAMQRLEAGQRAYDRPPKIPLPPRIAEQIIAALVTAAPVKALGGDADAVRARALQHLEVVSAPTPAPARVPPAAAAQATPSAPAAAPPAAAARPGPFAPGDVAPAPATQAAPFLPAEAPPAPVIDVAPPAANEAGPRDMPAHVATPAAAGPAQTPAAPAMPQGGNGRSLRGRAARLAVAERQAAIAERLAIARHRVLGPSRGSVERRGALRSQLKRRSTDPPVGRSARAAGATREAELTAIALFVSVAAIVATVTFLAAPGL